MAKNIYLVIIIAFLIYLVRFGNASIDLTASSLSFDRNREYLGNRGALYGTQRKVPTNFIPYSSRLVLVLLS